MAMTRATMNGNSRIGIAAAICSLSAMFGITAVAQPPDAYTVNGESIAPEMAQLMSFYGLTPGAYYIDPYGNYGLAGEAPLANIDGGPTRNWSGVEPVGIENNAYAQAYVNGVTGVRFFWVYSPSIFSGATGGSSGYVHVCPANVYHRSSEGATNIGGGYDSSTGQNDSWAGVAGMSRNSGRWAIESGSNGPTLAFYDNDGGVQRVAISTMLQGRWKAGQTTYAVEVNKAAC